MFYVFLKLTAQKEFEFEIRWLLNGNQFFLAI